MRYIRKWTIHDAKDLAACLNNKLIQDNLRDGIPFPYTVSDAEGYIRGVCAAPKDCQYAWAIQQDGKAIGSIGIFRKENIHKRTAQLGYFLAQPYWGKGIATGAVKQARDYVFEHTDILRIFAEPFAYNTASCRVLEKAGFVLEGTMRMNAVKNGRVLDMQLYACCKG